MLKYSGIILFIMVVAGCSKSDSDSDATNPYLTNHASAAATAVSGASDPLKTALAAAPTTYAFTSQAGDGSSSVSYKGQTFRQILNDDLKAWIGTLTAGGYSGSKAQALEALNSYFAYDAASTPTAPGAINGSSTISTGAKDTAGANTTTVQTTYDDVRSSGKQLKSKLAGIDNALRHSTLKGWGSVETPEALIATWFDTIATNATSGSPFQAPNGTLDTQTVHKAYVTGTGLDLQQLVQKFLHGAVSYSQASGDYLSTDLGDSKGLNADNSGVATGKTYSSLEHHWDEAFGYFGAARDYLAYTDAQNKAGVSIDTNGDGKIDLLTEKNFGLSVNAGKRDVTTANDPDLSAGAMQAFLQGRHLIATKPEGYRDLLPSLAIVAVANWEKTIVATVIHYINDTIADMDNYGTADYSFTDHAKHWSEMKGFALGLQFNPKSTLSSAGFDKVHELMGTAPVLGPGGGLADYKTKLIEARNVLKDTYGFSGALVEKL